MNKPQLYEAYKEVSERNKVLQLFNNVLEVENKKLKDDLSWKDNDLYYAEKQRNSDKMFIERIMKERDELRKKNKNLKVLKNHYEECIKLLEQDKKDYIKSEDRELDKLIKQYNKLKEEKDELLTNFRDQ